jgi:hypothetical protein
MNSADLEFHVEVKGTLDASVFKNFNSAKVRALDLALSGSTVYLDVVVWSEGAARAWGGDDAVEQYREDPEASVFERFEVKVNAMGRVP